MSEYMQKQFLRDLALAMESGQGWAVDLKTLQSSQHLFMHRGGQNGMFIEITAAALVRIGVYGNHYRSMDDAWFTQKYEHQFGDSAAAIKWVYQQISAAGYSFTMLWPTEMPIPDAFKPDSYRPRMPARKEFGRRRFLSREDRDAWDVGSKTRGEI